MNTNVYIDGFNFYYGATKSEPGLKWLDMRQLSCDLIRGHAVKTVRYFTARVDDRPGDLDQSRRQDVYLRALAATGVDLHFGQFRTRPKFVPLAHPPKRGPSVVEAMITEEKGTDVALASHIVWDCAHKLVEQVLVISNDSDLQTPVDMAIELGIRVVVINPHRHSGQTDHLIGNERRNLTLRHLRKAQLPAIVIDESGREIRRPKQWS